MFEGIGATYVLICLILLVPAMAKYIISHKIGR